MEPELIVRESKCENCIHESVCVHCELLGDILNKMETRLDSCCSPDCFIFSFKCNEFMLRKVVRKCEDFL